jgi:predicted secreted protein
MTIAQFIVAYAVCWWLMLFMVLPHKANPPANPGLGHAPSAPANPRLRKKFLTTTLLAFIPTILIYFLALPAKAQETIYHVGGGCDPLETYTPDAALSTRDGFGVGDKKVAPANLAGDTVLGGMEHVDIPLHIPVEPYVNSNALNADLSESNARIGILRVGMDGSTSLNGRSIENQPTYDAKCHDKETKK